MYEIEKEKLVCMSLRRSWFLWALEVVEQNSKKVQSLIYITYQITSIRIEYDIADVLLDENIIKSKVQLSVNNVMSISFRHPNCYRSSFYKNVF